MNGAVLLVFANKQDVVTAATTRNDAAALSSCMTPAQIAELLQLQAIRSHSWHMQSCCAITGEGLDEGIEWLTLAVTKA